MDVTGKYFLIKQTDSCSPLSEVERKKQLSFPVYLKKAKSQEIKEIILQTTDILELTKLSITTVDALKEIILGLIRDILVWYQKRYHNENEQKRIKYEKQGFLPILFPSHSLNISGEFDFYSKEQRNYKEEECVFFFFFILSI